MVFSLVDKRYLVFNLIRQEGPISRSAISRRLHLSSASTTVFVKDLLNAALVVESGQGISRGGRRPILLQFNDDCGYAMGFELDVTRIVGVLSNLGGKVLSMQGQPFNVNDGPASALTTIVAMSQKLLKEARVPNDKLLGAAIGMSGPVLYEEGIPLSPPIMPGWDGYPLRQQLQDALSMPVYLDNDANLGALGEYTYGEGRGIANLVYLKVNSGIGAGFILRGQLFRGAWGVAGEIGHVSIDEDGPPCSCGNNGCLEAMAGEPAIVARATQAVRAGHPTLLAERAAQHPLVIDDVVQCAQRGDETSRQVLALAGTQIGVALGDLVNLLNPRLLILGGEAILKAGVLITDALVKMLHRKALRAASRNLEIRYSRLAGQATPLGGVALVWENRRQAYVRNVLAEANSAKGEDG